MWWHITIHINACKRHFFEAEVRSQHKPSWWVILTTIIRPPFIGQALEDRKRKSFISHDIPLSSKHAHLAKNHTLLIFSSFIWVHFNPISFFYYFLKTFRSLVFGRYSKNAEFYSKNTAFQSYWFNLISPDIFPLCPISGACSTVWEHSCPVRLLEKSYLL